MDLYNFSLLIIFILVIGFPLLRKDRDFFSPTGLWAILTLFNSAPFLTIAFTTQELSSPLAMYFIGGGKYGYIDSLHRYMYLQMLFAICYYFSYYRLIRIDKRFSASLLSITVSKTLCKHVYIICYATSFILAVNFIISFGGIVALLASFTNRDEIIGERQAFFSLINALVAFGAIFHVKYLSYCKKRFWGLALCLTIGVFISSLYGGRSPFLVYILMVGICYNFFIAKVNIFSLSLWPIYLFAAVFFVLILGLRISAGSEMSEMLGNNSMSLLGGNSYVDIQACTIKYFDTHDFWWGKTFHNLWDVFLPHQIYPEKSPTDDGVYYYTIVADGGDVFRYKEFDNSWPPSTLSSMYANFGLLGVIVGAYFFAYIQKYVFKWFTSNTNNILVTYLFCYIVTRFQLTRFYFANLSFTIIWLIIFSIFIKIIFTKRKVPPKT